MPLALDGDDGEPGPPGPTGPAGPAGVGAAWWSGVGPPTVAHNLGDYYLDLLSGDVYKQTSTLTPYSSVVLADNPTAYWQLDELSGTTANDGSGHGINGTNTLVTQGQSPVIGSGTAYGFNGSTSHIDIPTNSGFNAGNAYTLEAWIRTSASASGQPEIICADNTVRFFQFCLDATGHAKAIFSNNGSLFQGPVVGATVINDGLRHHVVAVCDIAATQLRVYVDGALDGTFATSSFTLMNTNDGMVIGARLNGGSYTQPWNGTLDEVAVYAGRVLSVARIGAHYSAGIASASSIWTKQGNIRGPQGAPGVDGDEGEAGLPGPQGPAGAGDPTVATRVWTPLFDSDGTLVLDSDEALVMTLIPLLSS